MLFLLPSPVAEPGFEDSGEGPRPRSLVFRLCGNASHITQGLLSVSRYLRFFYISFVLLKNHPLGANYI